MSEQYFSKNPTSAHNERAIELNALGVRARFVTDAGVFSRGEMDDGTRILLDALPPICGRALDLGCGWGAVGTILGAKYPHAQIIMSDVNARACELASANITRNGVKNARVIESDAFENIEGEFDFIISNPPIRAGKRVIYPMFISALERLSEGGRLYLVIRKQQGAQSAVNHIIGAGVDARVIAKEKGYWVIMCARKITENEEETNAGF